MANLRMNTTTVQGLKTLLATYLKSNLVLNILGGFGLGKSAIVNQTAETMGYTLLDVRISQSLPEDFGGALFIAEYNGEKTTLRGMPEVIQRVTKLRNDTGKPVLLFFDEFNSGLPSVMAAMYQILLDRSSAGFDLPEDTRIICAGNREEDMGVVHDIPMPANNRMGHVYFQGPTWDEFESYALSRKFHPAVLAFLKFRPDYLLGWDADGGPDTTDTTEPTVPTPRTWEMASTLLHQLENSGLYADRTVRSTTLASIIGTAATAAMASVFELVGRVTSFDEVMADPHTAPVPASDDLKAKYTQMVLLTTRVESSDQLNKAVTFLDRVSEDMTAVAVLSLANNNDTLHLISANPELLMRYSSRLQELNAVNHARNRS